MADEEKAREVLGLSEGLRGEIAKNVELRTAGTRPAGEIYTGVLYDALDLASLDTAARRRAGKSLLVFSGLWGAVRVGDRIPSYRCSMGVKLPGLGALGAYWRAPMAEVMPEAAGDGLVLDLRSSAYAAAWKPKGEVAERTATCAGAALPDGGRGGEAVGGQPLQQGDEGADGPRPAAVGGPAERARRSWWRRCGSWGTWWRRRLPGGPGRPWALDVVVTEIH